MEALARPGVEAGRVDECSGCIPTVSAFGAGTDLGLVDRVTALPTMRSSDGFCDFRPDLGHYPQTSR
jgi:hypothetical protein